MLISRISVGMSPHSFSIELPCTYRGIDMVMRIVDSGSSFESQSWGIYNLSQKNGGVINYIQM
jgi:hypothetical protein